MPGNIYSEDHLLSDEDSATVGGKDLLFAQVLPETKLSSESCLLCKIDSWSGLRSPGPPGKCSTLSYNHSPAVNFPRTLKASDQLISRDRWAIYNLGQECGGNVHPDPVRRGDCAVSIHLTLPGTE